MGCPVPLLAYEQLLKGDMAMAWAAQCLHLLAYELPRGLQMACPKPASTYLLNTYLLVIVLQSSFRKPLIEGVPYIRSIHGA
jgi:hypothetical protein